LSIENEDSTFIVSGSQATLSNSDFIVNSTSASIIINPTDGLLMQNVSGSVMHFDTSGNLYFSGSLSGPGGEIGGWIIGETKLSSSGIGLGSANDASGYAFWAGNDTPANAEFSVTHEGFLVASSASVTGTIYATGGEISGSLTMPGTESAISIGSTPPASASSGTGIWIDRTGLYSLNSSSSQIKIDSSNGVLYAGEGGTITLSSNGFRIRGISTAMSDYNSLTFTNNSGHIYAQIRPYLTSALNPEGALYIVTYDQNGYSIDDGIVIFDTGTVTIGNDFQCNENGNFDGDLTAASYADNTPFFDGNALFEIKQIKAKDGKLDHSTLPDFAKKIINKEKRTKKTKNGMLALVDNEVETETTIGRDLGASISINTVAIQQLIDKIEDLELELSQLKKKKEK
jgi:hypothetical protein